MNHDDVWHVLPFYVNGTLRGQARTDTEAHLITCAECRAELSTQTQVRDTILQEDVRQESAQVSFEQLWQRIVEHDAVAEAHAMRAGATSATAAVPRARAGRAVKWLAAAVIVEGIGLATLGAMSWNGGPSISPDYRTLSAQEAPLPAGQIRAVFSEDLRLADLRDLLSSSKLRVVDGPTPSGVYTLALDGSGGESVDGAVEHLRGSPAVRLAEPLANAVEQ